MEGGRIIEEFRAGGKLIWAFINEEKDKGNDASVLITVRDMVHDSLVRRTAHRGTHTVRKTHIPRQEIH
ncbi:hypothetical protein LCGC14_1649620 [marine sediment metagenome]|uniref:Uncharacterized protein n=1 Tax=marine sediment metagenome TaxID=412755 RepID=A0A0F9KXG4_9ZZZZ